MTDNSTRAKIQHEDGLIASFARDIERFALVAPMALPPPPTTPNRDTQPSDTQRKGQKKATHVTEPQIGQRPPRTSNRNSSSSYTRERRPTTKTMASSSSSAPITHTVSELHDTELEEALRNLVRSFSTSPSLNVDLTTKLNESGSGGENFEWLMQVVARRVAHQPKLSGARHQFALLLIAAQRRNESLSVTSPEYGGLFKVVWDTTTMSMALDVLISDISSPYSPSSYMVHLDCLRALSLVLFDNACHYSRYYASLFAVLRPLCDARIVLDKETHRVAFNCLANMCYRSGSYGQAHYEEIWNLWMRQAALLQPQVMIQPTLSRVFSALLRGIQYIIPEAKHIHDNGLPSLISMLHKFIFYGTNIGGSILAPLLSPSSSSSSLNGKLGTNNSDDENEEDIVSTGSEYSGSDVYNDKHALWKVRFHALGCLQAISRESSEKFVQFWSHLLPQSPQQPSLITIIQLDPVHQVRSAAYRLISSIFDGQRLFLQVTSSPYRSTNHGAPTPKKSDSTPTKDRTSPSAQYSTRTNTSPKSFTPLSTQLVKMLTEVHSGLYKAFTTETRQTTVLAIVKTLGTLAQETPYNNLNPGFVTMFMTQLQRFALDKSDIDHRMRRATISTLASFVGVTQAETEVVEFLSGPGNALIEHFKVLLLEEPNFSIKTEVFRFFSSLASKYPQFILPHWDTIYTVILETITGEKAQEVDPNTRFAASKVVDDFSRSLLYLPPSASTSPSLVQHLSEFATELWRSILNSRITELMVKDRFGLVRGSICNLFSQIPAPVFASLSRKHQVICITLLLGATKDDAPAVRAQAARALGIYILNRALKVDPLFVSDVALALVAAMKDKNLNVRTKAAWSAANLCDALVTLREASSRTRVLDSDSTLAIEGDESTREDLELDIEESSNVSDIPRQTLVILAKSLLSLCKDNDKVRCNIVRALGNFIRFANEEMFKCDMNEARGPTNLQQADKEPRFVDTQQSISGNQLLNNLIDASLQLTREGSAKVRWNACYAIANLFHNQYIVTTFQTATTRAIDALLSVLTTSSNFKVRINAATALHLAASSGALRSTPHHLLAILQTVLPQLQQISLGDQPSMASGTMASGIDSKYVELLHQHLSNLIVGCVHSLSSLSEIPREMRTVLAKYSNLLEDILSRIESTVVDEAPSNSLAASSAGEAQDTDDLPLDSHSQLNPPTILELKDQAKMGLDLVRRFNLEK